MSNLEWHPVPGYPDYEVSSKGDVRRVTPGRGARAGHQLRPHITVTGYQQVALRADGKTTSRLVCQLVCEAFNGPRPIGMEVRHLDGNSRNDSAENLAWGTRQENIDDIRRHGTHANARKTHCVNGHPFSKENTKARENGGRRCRTCANESSRRAKARRRAAQTEAAA